MPFTHVLLGIVAGLIAGVLFGEATAPLGIVATGFIRLLQVNVLPYLLGSLIASLGSRDAAEMKVIARYGIFCLLLVWILTLLLVVFSPLALPPFTGAPLLSVEDPPAAIDWLDLYIPSNLFHALANNLIPAVVLFGLLAGVALGQISSDRKAVLLQALDALNATMAGVSRLILRLTPFGLFAIAAVTAGHIRWADVMRLQVWFHFYLGGTLLLSLWVLPTLVARLTSVRAGRFLAEMRTAIVTAAAAGDALVVLPLIAESAKKLLAEHGAEPSQTESAVGVAVPLLYNFPHVGKILSLAFLPFGAWFVGSNLSVRELGLLASAGPLSLFGSINAAIPFLLDLLHLPADLFELFTMSSVLNTRLGAMTAATHVATLSVILAAVMLGKVVLSVRRLLPFVVATCVLMAGFILGTRVIFTWWLEPAPAGLETLAPFELRPPLAKSGSAAQSPAETTPLPGRRLDEIKQRKLLRVGYFPDSVPWAFVNARGELVGYDIEAAHRLAAQLAVDLQFVAIRRTAPVPSTELNSGRIDLVMSGLAATVSRAERMSLSAPYNREHEGFLVRDYERSRFATLQALQAETDVVIAAPPLETALTSVKQKLPLATLRQYDTIADVIDDRSVTAILASVERASYWSRLRSEFTAVAPDGWNTSQVVVYAVPIGEAELKGLVDLWIETRRASGEEAEAYQYWIRGKALNRHVPRWSVLQEILGGR